ncbi:MAG: COR domain-containing protein [Nostoc sp. ChiSLP02]|nr:COR domain-containing protein [Nostoc sp. DedSLP05]MDZ8103299.1 COR domain-containing protein [Nostoc sp. DedSLP01]MDZ8187747.1 COR domain-containing protein [Nostoc sp. ChiSLP02]
MADTPQRYLEKIREAKEKQLKELDLSNSWRTDDKEKLTEIPAEVFELEWLEVLNLSGNQLTTLPEAITRLQQLTTLDLNDNPIEKPPPEVVAKGIEAIKDYFRELEQGTDYLYEAKLLIVGEGGAGKTTLIKKIENQNYQLREEDITKGIQVVRWSFPMENGREFRVNIWDFGGQEIYHATHQFFLTKRSLYVLVADTRKEDTDFYYWLNVVELLSDNSPLLIIKNEKQNRHRDINERQLRGQFTNLKETLATNLATNRGLEKVLEQIKHYVKNLPHIGTKLPTTWVKVRKALESDARNYISLDEYLNICQQNGLTQRYDKLQLSEYLHDLGVCLHFQQDPLLYNIVILKPNWITYAVYKVLDNEKVIRNLGSFTWSDLVNIWCEEEYAAMHGEILHLMIKFNLCYEIPRSQGKYIAPQLLSANQPSYDWDENKNLILRYTYDFMPKGIITQFIVAMHELINEQKCVWKSGVILSTDQTKAEVIEYYGKREIKIRVSGRHTRDLMTIVTHELDKIHDSYQGLRYNKLIPCSCRTCKDSQEPHFYSFEILRKFLADKQEHIQCQKSYDLVSILELLDTPFDIKVLTNINKPNEQTNLVPEILAIPNQSLNVIANFLKQGKTQNLVPLYEAKILIVGEPGAGKTSLMKKLIDPTYQVPNDERSTLGIKVHFGYTFQYSKDKSISFRANIWDFGGQEIQYALHQFFLTTDSLYILVADDREQRTEFNYWFDIIKLLGGNSPVLVVLNEKNYNSITNFDLHTYRQRYSELKIECCSVNLSSNDNRIKILTNKIQNMLSNLEHIGRKVLPEGWLLVRSELEKIKDKKNHITIEEYFRICETSKIREETNKLLLSKYLHNLGIIVHFQNDSHLYSFIILNPQWATDAIYAFLSNKLLIKRGGRFNKELLFSLWSKKYSFNEKNQLLNLMKKNNFDICYSINTSDNYEFIIPQLLPNKKINYQWNDNDNLRFRFKFPFMPKGILAQLIVQLSTYIAQNQRGKHIVWKTGVVFVQNDADLQSENVTQAEVIENLDLRDRTQVIDIRVSGLIDNKKALLVIIRQKILEICRIRFPGILFTEQIPCNCSRCNKNSEPHFYDYYEELITRVANGSNKIECRKSLKKVNIQKLIYGVIGKEQYEKERNVSRDTHIHIEKIIYGNTKSGDNILNVSTFERGIALAMALAVLVTFIFLVLNPRAMEGSTLAIIRFLAATFAGISAYFFTGTLGLEAHVPLNKTNIKAGGAFAAFVLVLLLFFYGVPASENQNNSKPVSDANTTRTTIASLNQHSDRL